MIASRLVDVEALNELARANLRARGRLAEDEVTLGNRDFTAGDEVIALRNAYDIGVLNGTRLRITRIDTPDNVLRCSDDSGRPIDVPFSFAADGYVAHSYATTIHKAPGATVQRAFILVDDSMANERLYTALSRATDRTDLFVDAVGAVEHETTYQSPPCRPRSDCETSLAARLASRSRSTPIQRGELRVVGGNPQSCVLPSWEQRGRRIRGRAQPVCARVYRSTSCSPRLHDSALWGFEAPQHAVEREASVDRGLTPGLWRAVTLARGDVSTGGGRESTRTLASRRAGGPHAAVDDGLGRQRHDRRAPPLAGTGPGAIWALRDLALLYRSEIAYSAGSAG